MVVQQVLSNRLRAMKQAHVRVYFDGTNAFASTDREVLREIDMQMKGMICVMMYTARYIMVVQLQML